MNGSVPVDDNRPNVLLLNKRFTTCLTRGLFREAAAYGLGAFFLKGLPIVIIPACARLLTPDEFGMVLLAASTSTLLIIIMPWGFNSALVHFYAQTEHEDRRRSITRTIFIAFLGSSAVTCMLVEMGRLVAGTDLIGQLPHNPHLRLIMASSMLATMSAMIVSLWQVQRQPALATFLSCTTAVLVQMASIAGLFVFRRDALGFLMGALAGSVGAVFVGLAVSRDLFRGGFSPNLVRPALAYGFPLSIHGLMAYLTVVADRLILARYAELDEVAAYVVAAQTASALGLIGVAFNTAWMPFLYEWSRRRESTSPSSLAGKMTMFSGLLLWSALVLWMIGPELLHFMSPSLVEQSRGFYGYLLTASFASNLYYLPVSFVFVRGRSKAALACTASAAACSVALNLLLIPRYGATGAAITQLVSGLVLLGVAISFSLRELRNQEFLHYFMRLSVTGIVFVGAGIVFDENLAMSSLGVRLGLIASAPLVMVATGGIRWRDFGAILKPRTNKL